MQINSTVRKWMLYLGFLVMAIGSVILVTEIVRFDDGENIYLVSDHSKMVVWNGMSIDGLIGGAFSVVIGIYNIIIAFKWPNKKVKPEPVTFSG